MPMKKSHLMYPRGTCFIVTGFDAAFSRAPEAARGIRRRSNCLRSWHLLHLQRYFRLDGRGQITHTRTRTHTHIHARARRRTRTRKHVHAHTSIVRRSNTDLHARVRVHLLCRCNNLFSLSQSRSCVPRSGTNKAPSSNCSSISASDSASNSAWKNVNHNQLKNPDSEEKQLTPPVSGVRGLGGWLVG